MSSCSAQSLIPSNALGSADRLLRGSKLQSFCTVQQAAGAQML